MKKTRWNLAFSTALKGRNSMLIVLYIAAEIRITFDTLTRWRTFNRSFADFIRDRKKDKRKNRFIDLALIDGKPIDHDLSY